MTEGDALTFDGVNAHRSGIEQHVDKVVAKQVHFIDVEDAAVGIGKQPGSNRLLPACSAAPMSIDPTSRSSVALFGSSTTRTGRKT